MFILYLLNAASSSVTRNTKGFASLIQNELQICYPHTSTLEFTEKRQLEMLVRLIFLLRIKCIPYSRHEKRNY